MLIIIEGVDCSGKTTLANKLAKSIGEEYVSLLRKGPPAFDNPVIEYLWPLNGYMPNSKQHIICDRWHIGEMIYPKLFNRKSIMTPSSYEVIHKTLMRLGALVVYLEPPLSKVHERFYARGDEFITDIDILNDSYFAFRSFTTAQYNFEYSPEVIKFSNITFDKDLIDAIIWTAKMRGDAYS